MSSVRPGEVTSRVSRRSLDIVDAWLWALVPALLLTAVGVGAVNGDAIRHANRFASLGWRPNPNHLLMEPVAALWYNFAGAVGWGESGVDRLKLLSFWVGGLTLALFRFLVAPAVTDERFYKNLSTAFLGGLQAYLVYWISGEPILLQMPALVVAAYALTRYFEHPDERNAAWMGAAFGLAALFFASNVVVGVFTLLALVGWSMYNDRSSLDFGIVRGFVGGALVVGTAGFVGGWLVADPGTNPLIWISRYSGDVPVSDHLFGIGELDPVSLVVAGARAVYGGVRAVVEVVPTVEAVRGETPWGLFSTGAPAVALLAGLLFVWALVRLYRSGGRGTKLAVALAGWIGGVMAFGVFYNNSDGQYFIQLTVPAAVLVAAIPQGSGGSSTTRLAACAIAGCILWNVGFAYRTYIAYPRAERLDQMTREIRGGNLVVYPGADTTGRLLHLLPDTLYDQRLSLMSWTSEYAGAEGLQLLADSMRAVLATKGDIRIVAVYGDITQGQPWSVLTQRGFSQADVLKLTEACSPVVVDSLGNGFSTRRLTGEPGCVQDLR